MIHVFSQLCQAGGTGVNAGSQGVTTFYENPEKCHLDKLEVFFYIILKSATSKLIRGYFIAPPFKSLNKPMVLLPSPSPSLDRIPRGCSTPPEPPSYQTLVHCLFLELKH